MLTLNRKPGLSVHIGTDIEVTYLERFHSSVLLEARSLSGTYQKKVHINETHQVTNEVSVCPTRIQGIQIRMNIVAPKHLRIYRSELWEKIESEARALSIFEVKATHNTQVVNIAARTETEALAHFHTLKDASGQPECTAVHWVPDLLKYIESGYTGDAHIFDTLRIACLEGARPPFAINLPKADSHEVAA